MKHLLKLLDCSSEEIVNLLDMADQLKYENKHNIPHRHLEGKSLGLIFEKLSTRTRVSFETGMYQLGGRAMFLSRRDMQTNRGELQLSFNTCPSRHQKRNGNNLPHPIR